MIAQHKRQWCPTCGLDIEDWNDHRSRCPFYEDGFSGYSRGAAVAFGLIGMAEAIRQREASRPKRELDAWYERSAYRGQR